MKNTIQFPIIVLAFAMGAFLPYLGLNQKIEKMNSKMDDMMAYVNSTNDRIDYIHIVERNEKDTNTVHGYTNAAWDQKLYTWTMVNRGEARQVSDKFKSAN